MANIYDIAVSAGINLMSAFIFLLGFALLRIQPLNDRVYFPKWYIRGLRSNPREKGAHANKFINLNFKSYVNFLNWMPSALKMPEAELIDHAGLDSAVYLRIYLLGIKMFVPVTVLALSILVPINFTNRTLATLTDVTYSNIDKMSISNVPRGSPKFFVHIAMEYAFTFWSCFVLYKEYARIAEMRLRFFASDRQRPEQFTVLVRNVPPDSDESVGDLVEHFFLVNHPDHYLTSQVVYNANKLVTLVADKKKNQNWLDYYKIIYSRQPEKRPMMKAKCLGLSGEEVDALDYYTAETERLVKEIAEESEKVKQDPECIMRAAFVSFKTRWGAAVCAQTQQTRNPTVWLTEWAPEPRDVYWPSLSIPYVHLRFRRLIMTISFLALTFFYLIPITFVQSLASIEGIVKTAPFLQPVVDMPFVKSLLQGFLPGLALKIFLLILPTILMIMSKFEGFECRSAIERRSASRYYYFNFINVFLGSLAAGSAFEQLHTYLGSSANRVFEIIGVAIPMKATFFITYIMVDGWTAIASEIFRLKALLLYHLKNIFLVKTRKDREAAMDAGSLEFYTGEPQIQLYILLGLVYAVVTPILLPFILVFFGFSYLVFRHQIINVYNQEYESAAAFWPAVHGRIIIAMVFSQCLLMGLLSTKRALSSTPFLVALPLITIWFHYFCKARFEPAFKTYPLQEAMIKDTLERTKDPDFNFKGFLQDAYLHPVFKDDEEDEDDFFRDDQKEKAEIEKVPTKRHIRNNTSSEPSQKDADSRSPSPPKYTEHL